MLVENHLLFNAMFFSENVPLMQVEILFGDTEPHLSAEFYGHIAPVACGKNKQKDRLTN